MVSRRCVPNLEKSYLCGTHCLESHHNKDAKQQEKRPGSGMDREIWSVSAHSRPAGLRPRTTLVACTASPFTKQGNFEKGSAVA
jgi:hypothetical protein